MDKIDLAAKKERLFAAISSEELDGYWVVKPENVRYLTGFPGEDSTLLVTGGRYYLVTDRRFSEEAQGTAFVDEVVLRGGSMASAAGELCHSLAVRHLCITASNVTCSDYKEIGDAGRGVEVSLRRPGLVEGLRLLKSEHELELIRCSARAAEEGFRRLMGHLEAGESERRLAARLEWEMICAGAEGHAFETICAVGEHASMPHARPGGRRARQGESVLFDWGARVRGYNSDLTRVIVLGKMPARVRELSDVVLAAQEAAFAAIGPDVEAGEVDSAARRVIEEAGFGPYFSHGLGHGIGLEVHEAPALAPGKKERLRAGMVMTVEPAVYIPGRCGVRIEEMACITAEGHVRITGLERVPVCIGC